MWVRVIWVCNCVRIKFKNTAQKFQDLCQDRIDINLIVPAVEYEKLVGARQGQSSIAVRELVIKASQIKQKRFRASSTRNYEGMSRMELGM